MIFAKKRAQLALGAQDKSSQQQTKYKTWRSKTKEILVQGALQGLISQRLARFLIKHGGFANE